MTYAIEMMTIFADEYEDGMRALLEALEEEADMASSEVDFPTEEALEEEGIAMGYIAYSSWA